jgi:hypothetical protein
VSCLISRQAEDTHSISEIGVDTAGITVRCRPADPSRKYRAYQRQADQDNARHALKGTNHRLTGKQRAMILLPLALAGLHRWLSLVETR